MNACNGRMHAYIHMLTEQVTVQACRQKGRGGGLQGLTPKKSLHKNFWVYHFCCTIEHVQLKNVTVTLNWLLI